MLAVVASDLDFARFGVSIARVAIEGAEDVSQLVASCRELGIQMAIARTNALDLPGAQALEAAGGTLCDTLVYYSRRVDSAVEVSPSVRLAGPSDADHVAVIAGAAFTEYVGHYQADPRLDEAAADEVYADWARRTCTVPGVADRVWLIEDRGHIAGFLAMRFNGVTESEVVLNAVHPDDQRRGLFTKLIQAALDESFRRRVERCIISTQVGNSAAQRAWSKIGFEPMSAYHTFHVWLDRVPSGGEARPRREG